MLGHAPSSLELPESSGARKIALSGAKCGACAQQGKLPCTGGHILLYQVMTLRKQLGEKSAKKLNLAGDGQEEARAKQCRPSQGPLRSEYIFGLSKMNLGIPALRKNDLGPNVFLD